MIQCPNCNYKLVLLPYRAKYKCSLCSKLFSKKFIENKDFRQWNKSQKLQDITNLKIKKKHKLKQIRDIKKALRYLFDGEPKSYSKKYINKKSREWRIKHREQDLKRKREYKLKNKETVLIRSRIRNQRMRQKQLALQLFKNKQYKLCTNQIQKVLPTFVLADLLVKGKAFYRGLRSKTLCPLCVNYSIEHTAKPSNELGS